MTTALFKTFRSPIVDTLQSLPQHQHIYLYYVFSYYYYYYYFRSPYGHCIFVSFLFTFRFSTLGLKLFPSLFLTTFISESILQ